MCDFADSDAAEQLLDGRVLTVKRVKELNAKDYFYQMLKDNPEITRIYPGIEDELLAFGITKEQIRTMLCDSPAKLMWLDD